MPRRRRPVFVGAAPEAPPPAQPEVQHNVNVDWDRPVRAADVRAVQAGDQFAVDRGGRVIGQRPAPEPPFPPDIPVMPDGNVGVQFEPADPVFEPLFDGQDAPNRPRVEPGIRFWNAQVIRQDPEPAPAPPPDEAAMNQRMNRLLAGLGRPARHMARDARGRSIEVEFAGAGVIMPAAAGLHAPEGAFCVPSSGYPDGYIGCFWCSWMYQASNIVHRSAGGSVCKTCFPQIAKCQMCGEAQTPETYVLVMGRQSLCKSCAPPPTPLQVKQKLRFKPKVEILKNREGAGWTSPNLG